MKLILLYKTIFVLSFGYICYFLCFIYLYFKLYSRHKTIKTDYFFYFWDLKLKVSHKFEYFFIIIFLFISIWLACKYIKYTTFFQIFNIFYKE